MSDFFYLPVELLHLTDSVEKTDDNSELQVYSYKNCSNESLEELKSYRGLVFDHEILVSSSLGFPPEYNEEEKVEFNLEDYSYFSSEEGTLLRVFYHQKWYLSTHRKLDAFKSRWGSNQSFGDIFLKCIQQSFDEFTEKLCQHHVYFFLIRNTKETRIVCNPPDKYTVYHIGTLLNNETFNIQLDIGITKQEKLKFENKNEIYNYVKTCDPFEKQGIIAFKNDGSGKHFKIVSSEYQNYIRVRNNEPDLNFRFLQLLRDQTSSVFQTFLKLYPEYKSKVNYYMSITFKLSKLLQNMYFKKFVQKEKIVFLKDEWFILKNVHQWFWEDRENRKITFDNMHRLALTDKNLRSFYRIMKKLYN